MDLKDLFQILISALSFTLMYIGADIDKKERRYPNKIVLITTILGMIYAFLSDRFLIAIILCIAMHFVGVFDGCLLKILKPGDWKMFATLPFYLPLENAQCFTIFACLLILNAIYTKLKTLKKLDFSSIKEAFKHERDAFKCLVILKEHIITDEKMLSIYKEETIPMTYVMMMPTIITFIINIIFLMEVV